jgi:type I restriction enzyme S subunit
MAGEASTLGDFLDATGGSVQTGPFGTKLKASEYTSTGVPVISVGEVGGGRIRLHDRTPKVDESVWGRMPEYILKEDDIVFGRKGAVERSAQIQAHEDGYFLGSDGIRVRLAERSCSPKFISYQLQDPVHKAWMIQHAAGTTMPSLNEGIIRRIPIQLPPLPEQKAIAHVLGSLDDKIELNRRMNETLEGMAQALFKSWFVDFDPVIDNALAAGNPIPEPLAQRAETRRQAIANGTANRESVQAFPASFRFTEELGWIPEGWAQKTIGDICDVRKGLSYKGKFLTDDISKTPLMNLGNFGGGGKFRSEKVKYYEGDFKERHLVQSGQLMIANTDMTQDRIVLGSPVVVPDFSSQEILFTHHTFAIDFKESHPESLWKPYLYYVTQESDFRQRAEGYATGTTVLALPKDALLKCPMLLPDSKKISKFASIVASIFEQQINNRVQSQTLAKLRDVLLPKLISGELRIPHAEKMVEDAIA